MKAFTVVNAPQRSAAWFAARAGRVTGSRAADILATLKKGGEASDRRNYRLQLACEQLTQRPQEDDYTNDAMQRGVDMEPRARGAYEALTGEVVQQSGFLSHNALRAGCSLDGHIGDFEGILEIKAPKTATHLGYRLAKVLPPAYVPQVTHNLLISGAEWCDFFSFDDRLPPNLQTFLVRVKREDVDLAAYQLALTLFLSEIEREVIALREAA